MSMIDELSKNNHMKSRELCEQNNFMMCPRCNGTKLELLDPKGSIRYGYKYMECQYCNGHGIITWTDRIIKGMPQ